MEKRELALQQAYLAAELCLHQQICQSHQSVHSNIAALLLATNKNEESTNAGTGEMVSRNDYVSTLVADYSGMTGREIVMHFARHCLKRAFDKALIRTAPNTAIQCEDIVKQWE